MNNSTTTEDQIHRLMVEQMYQGCSLGTPLGDLCGIGCECAIKVGIDPSAWMEEHS